MHHVHTNLIGCNLLTVWWCQMQREIFLRALQGAAAAHNQAQKAGRKWWLPQIFTKQVLRMTTWVQKRKSRCDNSLFLTPAMTLFLLSSSPQDISSLSVFVTNDAGVFISGTISGVTAKFWSFSFPAVVEKVVEAPGKWAKPASHWRLIPPESRSSTDCFVICSRGWWAN